jgi:prepilin-type N-terminal cleavage/methylation domain-containing protein
MATEAKHQRASIPARRATGGFTLVELIVAMTISLIIIGIASAILLSGTNMAQRTTQRALEEQIVDGVFNFAKDRLLYVGTVKAENLGGEEQALGLLYVSDKYNTEVKERGMLFFRDISDPSDSSAPAPINVMGEDFYMGYTVSLEAKLTNKVGNKPVLFIKVNLHSKTNPDQIIAKRELTFTLINGKVFNGSPNSQEITIAYPDALSFGPAESSTLPTS